MDVKECPDMWSVCKGTSQGKPIIVRIREGLKDATGHSEYPFQIGVAVPLLHPTKDGFPTDEEAEKLNEIENVLVERINQNSGVFAIAITTNGMREFVFYVKEWKPEFFDKEVKSLQGGPHELQFIMQKDPKWEIFKEFLPENNKAS